MGQPGKHGWHRAVRLCASTFMLTMCAPFLTDASTVNACTLPDTWSVASGFDLAANGLLPVSYPRLPSGGPRAVPPSLLKAVGWVESGWRQFRGEDMPLVSTDFGYGIMQITSGMSGAYGNPTGDIDAATQSRITSDAQYNIAYGAMMLAAKWNATPAVGTRDPAVVEDWYYALWAYNGWGWQNNPNNPRFTRHGTPASDPQSFPYQERVLYFVAHPPHDDQGNPLWTAVAVSLPSAKSIGKHPAVLVLKHTHSQPPATLSATYKPATLPPLDPGAMATISVNLRNTGTTAWAASGPNRTILSYHIAPLHAPASALSTSTGVVGSGAVPLPRSVSPGNEYTSDVRLKAPPLPGAYTVVWDLREGNGVTFSGRGIIPGRELLTVTRPGSSPAATPTPSPTPQTPVEGLRYVTDISAPDGTTLAAGQAFTKGWLVFNSGKRGWAAGWTVDRVGGAAMGAVRVTVPTTGACRSATIVVAQGAPVKPGRYRESWRLEDARGHPVGDSLTLDITVLAPSSTTPTPTPAPPRGTPTATPAGPTPTATATAVS